MTDMTPNLTTALAQARQAADRLSGNESDPGGRAVKINEPLIEFWIRALDYAASLERSAIRNRATDALENYEPDEGRE